MLQKLTYWQSKYEFLTYLLERRHDIEANVAEHLGLPRQHSCVVMPPIDWIHGSFNVCLPVHVDDGRSLVVRFPLPYKVGEANNPGNSDEKLRCEAATYIWIHQNCLDVPLPRLWGFALSTSVAVRHHQRIQGPSSDCLPSSALWKPGLSSSAPSMLYGKVYFLSSAILRRSPTYNIVVLII